MYGAGAEYERCADSALDHRQGKRFRAGRQQEEYFAIIKRLLAAGVEIDGLRLPAESQAGLSAGEGTLATLAQAMKSTRHNLLPGPRRSLDQHRGLPLRNQTDAAADFEHSVRVSNQLRQPYGRSGFQNGRRVINRTRRRLPG